MRDFILALDLAQKEITNAFLVVRKTILLFDRKVFLLKQKTLKNFKYL